MELRTLKAGRLLLGLLIFAMSFTPGSSSELERILQVTSSCACGACLSYCRCGNANSDSSCISCCNGGGGGTTTCNAGSYYSSYYGGCYYCPDGKYSSSSGATSCTSCPSGMSSYPDHSGCGYCPAGSSSTYSSSGTLCYHCSSGKYQPYSGQSSCLQCSSGYYQPSSGKTSCLQCSAGSYQPSSGQSTCLQCSAGSYQPSSGQSTCLQCSAGSYQPYYGETSCLQCSAGSYQPSSGQPTCLQCSAGSTSGTGATSCTAASASNTPSSTTTLTSTGTPTSSTTPSLSPTSSITGTPTSSTTPSLSPTSSITGTPTSSTTPSLSPTSSTTPSVSPTSSTTPSVSPTSSTTPSVSPTSSTTPSLSPTSSITGTPTSSTTPSLSPTSSITGTPTSSTTPSLSLSSTSTPTPSCTPTTSVSFTPLPGVRDDRHMHISMLVINATLPLFQKNLTSLLSTIRGDVMSTFPHAPSMADVSVTLLHDTAAGRIITPIRSLSSMDGPRSLSVRIQDQGVLVSLSIDLAGTAAALGLSKLDTAKNFKGDLENVFEDSDLISQHYGSFLSTWTATAQILTPVRGSDHLALVSILLPSTPIETPTPWWRLLVYAIGGLAMLALFFQLYRSRYIQMSLMKMKGVHPILIACKFDLHYPVTVKIQSSTARLRGLRLTLNGYVSCGRGCFVLFPQRGLSSFEKQRQKNLMQSTADHLQKLVDIDDYLETNMIIGLDTQNERDLHVCIRDVIGGILNDLTSPSETLVPHEHPTEDEISILSRGSKYWKQRQHHLESSREIIGSKDAKLLQIRWCCNCFKRESPINRAKRELHLVRDYFLKEEQGRAGSSGSNRNVGIVFPDPGLQIRVPGSKDATRVER